MKKRLSVSAKEGNRSGMLPPMIANRRMTVWNAVNLILKNSLSPSRKISQITILFVDEQNPEAEPKEKDRVSDV